MTLEIVIECEDKGNVAKEGWLTRPSVWSNESDGWMIVKPEVQGTRSLCVDGARVTVMVGYGCWMFGCREQVLCSKLVGQAWQCCGALMCWRNCVSASGQTRKTLEKLGNPQLVQMKRYCQLNQRNLRERCEAAEVKPASQRAQTHHDASHFGCPSAPVPPPHCKASKGIWV